MTCWCGHGPWHRWGEEGPPPWYGEGYGPPPGYGWRRGQGYGPPWGYGQGPRRRRFQDRSRMDELETQLGLLEEQLAAVKAELAAEREARPPEA